MCRNQWIVPALLKDFEFACLLPVGRYTLQLRAEAEKIKGFSDYLRGKESLSKCFSSYWDDDKRFNKDDQPVVGVSWYAAQAYCLWLSLLESNGKNTALYRLPTEKEWEYAAGGKESRTYPWGEEEPSSRHANYKNNEGAPTPAGRYPKGATPEGLYDMAGSVWEWTAVWYDKNYLAIRGGDYRDTAAALRCSSRDVVDQRLGDYLVCYRVIRSSLFSS